MDGILSTSITRTNCSFAWKSLSKVWPEVLNNVIWAICDGRTINFWNDICLNLHRPLRDFYIGIGQLVNTLCVCDVVDDVEGWDWVRLRRWLLCSILNYITAMISPSPSSVSNQLIWKWRVSDKFSSKEMFKNLYQDISIGSST